MGRLTETDGYGNWRLKGVPWKNLHEGEVITRETHEAVYGALCKLKDYEDTGLSPEEVERMKEPSPAKCVTGKSGSGYCGAAAYCSEPVDCCVKCSDKCNSQCGWLEE